MSELKYKVGDTVIWEADHCNLNPLTGKIVYIDERIDESAEIVYLPYLIDSDEAQVYSDRSIQTMWTLDEMQGHSHFGPIINKMPLLPGIKYFWASESELTTSDIAKYNLKQTTFLEGIEL